VLSREGRNLATYGLASGPQGYRPLREFLAASLAARTGMRQTADDVLIVSGSLQALDLVNAVLLAPGDTVIVEASTYQGTLERLARCGVRAIGAPLDEDGIDMDALSHILDALKAEGSRAKYIYTIPTVQNPTGAVMSRERRLEMLRIARAHDVAIFEDDCYADLLWDGDRPPAIRALDEDGRVVYCGSFSKTVSPAFRVGYAVAEWPALSQMMALKTDGGTAALEQITLAELAPLFEAHVEEVTAALKDKCQILLAAMDREFGASAEATVPKGGIFVWFTLPEEVDTVRLGQAALAEGVALNAGPEWSTDAEYGRNRLRLCFANTSRREIDEGVAKLAEVCHREFGVPVRSANVQR
jgi:2-aminoadipate transaminase